VSFYRPGVDRQTFLRLVKKLVLVTVRPRRKYSQPISLAYWNTPLYEIFAEFGEYADGFPLRTKR